MRFQELNGDQRRETVNTRQRYAAWRAALADLEHYKGSMVWAEDRGAQYLVRSAYGSRPGIRRQRSLGRRSPETERLKAEFEEGRAAAKERLAAVQAVLERQGGINRAVGLGRVPLLGARIIRAIDGARLLGGGIRVVGTNAVYAYEAVSGVFVEATLTTTEDMDLLFDARRRLNFATSGDVPERSLLSILRRVDRSFTRMPATFRATNRDGYFVDLIRPMPSPPWASHPEKLGDDEDDLTAVDVAGLHWLSEAPSFEAVAIDESGSPLRIVAPDPRAFAVHKWWLSHQPSRDPSSRRRDAEQARAVAQLVIQFMPHLPYDRKEIEVVPKEAFDAARPLFAPPPASGTGFP
ncbi:MAG: nucleotidyltransferase domain-containing protein [Rhizobiales bacterium]|nr:nucleotidyltransferase domain-containing protein [Hyphomicrobiales bacterium]MBN9010477.1 nucleotidyltransferase domain-containing protein [Hyphomicrobiales bacterium]